MTSAYRLCYTNPMNDLDYKTQVLDPISPSFCAAKWYNATIWLGSGQTTSCHHPPAHAIDANAVVTNPSALHNTDQKKADRRLMLAGQRPQGCEYCWRIEDMAASTGTTPVSDRVYKSRIYPIAALHAAAASSPDQDVDLRTLEIAFDRTCQLACSYCNPAFSSTWVKDIKTQGPYTNLHSDGRNHFTHTHDAAQLYTINQSNPYVDAFFQWWESSLHHTLQELRITGGEPLMSGATWRLINWFKNNSHRSSTRLAINSNLGPQVDVYRLIDSTAGVNVEIYTSQESVGAQAEYIRHGLDYDLWRQNVLALLDAGKTVHFMATINALCLTTLTNHLNQLLEWKRTYGRDRVNFTLNILRFPSFQSAVILPADLRSGFRDSMVAWLVAQRGSNLLQEHEIRHVERLVDYLDVVRTPHQGAAQLETLRKDFHSFYQQYDQRRGLNFEARFPDLAPWYKTLASGAV